MGVGIRADSIDVARAVIILEPWIGIGCLEVEWLLSLSAADYFTAAVSDVQHSHGYFREYHRDEITCTLFAGVHDSSSERGNTDFVTSGHRSLPGEPLFSFMQLQSQLELARRVRQTPCSELGPRSFEVLFAACEGSAEGTLSGFDVQTTKGCVAHTLILHANHCQITVVQFTRGSTRAVTSTVVEVSRFFVDDLRLDYSVIHYRLIIIEPIQQ